MSRFPSLFVSHGSPTLALERGGAADFLRGYGERLGRPEAILVVSAHWETAAPTVGTSAAPGTIHDFRGFPEALHRIRYPAPGAPETAMEAARLVESATGRPVRLDPDRGLDHGAWVPLSLMYPAADIPVAQLSILRDGGPADHLALGEAIRPLRDSGVLVLASGSATHNLYEFRGNAHDAPAPGWVSEFGEWLAEAIRDGRTADLAHYRRLAPSAERNHPTEEHLMPLFAAIGAASPDSGSRGTRVHASHAFGVLAMDVYEFA
ncbi:dioxygenase [Skermanella mucosa]|uniref:DODA-type extradiol aromatic ring-opening family dioxygenase n=1 Tax=Skermanella mucosa TaxID=1789672 RepID=UPI00192CA790|nr:class III extradiol ring-cleavage dioxygenase [Skermanella mucosa]UEM21148.1 dioxygenase [Skermanella mucosa]